MTNYLERINAQSKGAISFLYHDPAAAPMPQHVADPLELLGDISLLHLSEHQKTELRTAIEQEVQFQGAESVWKGRAFRKNLIHSFGTIV